MQCQEGERHKESNWEQKLCKYFSKSFALQDMQANE